MFPLASTQTPMSRRALLHAASTGFGAVALAGLFSENASAKALDLPQGAALSKPHHTPKAKHVIFCFMSGGVSHIDSFDPKPRLQQDHGKPMPVKVERTMFNNNGNIMASPFRFAPPASVACRSATCSLTSPRSLMSWP
ncbi:MAG: DUF1501 domain-containing protein [Gemmatales bacterium]